MPLMQQILLAIRTLTEDEPPHHRKHHGGRHGHQNGRQHDGRDGRQRSNSKRQQAVNLVVTFRELFASGGFNFLVDDDAINRSINKSNKHNRSQRRESILKTPNHYNCELENTKTCLVDLSTTNQDNCELECANTCLVDLPEEAKRFSELDQENTVSIFHEQRLISSPELTLPIAVSYNSISEVRNRELNKNTAAILQEQRLISSPELALPIAVSSHSIPEARNREGDRNKGSFVSYIGNRELVAVGRNLKKRRQPVTVPLPSNDENKTVDALRKVLKWSPTKQNLATFTVSVPKEEEHKAVAVVQNAVNRVKEEQQKKKKKKFKLFKLTFC